MEIENGEGIIGYQYLHGTNANVGDFERDCTASIARTAEGSATVTLEMQYRWNDVIDPNPQYSTDRWKGQLLYSSDKTFDNRSVTTFLCDNGDRGYLRSYLPTIRFVFYRQQHSDHKNRMNT